VSLLRTAKPCVPFVLEGGTGDRKLVCDRPFAPLLRSFGIAGILLYKVMLNSIITDAMLYLCMNYPNLRHNTAF